MWQWVARGNIQQISYIPQTEQHSPFGLMLLHLGNVTIMCVCVLVETLVLWLCCRHTSDSSCRLLTIGGLFTQRQQFPIPPHSRDIHPSPFPLLPPLFLTFSILALSPPVVRFSVAAIVWRSRQNQQERL